MSKQLATLPASDADLHAARFLAMHNAATARGMEFKLLALFAGLEIVSLKDAFTAEHGETRGKKSHDGTFIKMDDWMRQKTGVPKSTAYRYASHYQSTAAAHPEAVAKIAAIYQKQVESLALGTAQEVPGALALTNAESLPAKALKALTDAPDVWGIHELFAAPAEETEPEDDDDDDDDDDDPRPNPTVVFFQKFIARVKAGEFARLPKPQLRQLAKHAEEVAQKAKLILSGKADPKAKN